MIVTPSGSHNLHRISCPLRWDPAFGFVEERANAEGLLLPQPSKGKFRGIPCFVPLCDAAKTALVRDTLVSVPNTPLPDGLQLVKDHTFAIRYIYEEERTIVGELYTLYVTKEMPTSACEQLYAELLQTFLPCTIQASGAATLLSLTDPHVMPCDPLTAVAVTALDALARAATTSDPHAAQFATLFALDMRACDEDFDEVLTGCGYRNWLVAAALDQYVARDPMVREAVIDAQDALEGALPGYKPQPCKYEPYWETL